MRDETRPRISRETRLSVAAMVAALIGLLALAPLAPAASDPVASGSTAITLNQNLYKKLKDNDVKVTAVKPATVKGKKITLPLLASESSMDPTTGAGTLTHKGGFTFKERKRKAVVKSLVLDTTKKGLFGKIGKKKLKIAALGGVSTVREGFGLRIIAKQLKLTKDAAKQLNKALHENVFKASKSLGSANSKEQPETVTATGGSASLTTSLPTLTKLAKDNVTLKVVPPANLAAIGPPPAFSFPVSGGSIAPDAGSGIVQTNGGLKLIQEFEVAPSVTKGTTMTLNGIWVNLATKTASVEVTVESTLSSELNLGKLERGSIADLSLTSATIKADSASHTVTVENATATLQAVTAETLNSLFATPFEGIKKEPAEKFAAGDPLGTVSMTVQTQ